MCRGVYSGTSTPLKFLRFTPVSAHHLLLTLHGDLAELLLRHYRPHTEISYPLSRRASIKDIIEAVGIPHTEIGAVEKKGTQLDFTYLPEPGEKLDIYPVAAGAAATAPNLLRTGPPAGHRFLVDINVARLAGLLRMAGFDTDSVQDWQRTPAKREIARRCSDSGRILLSRDKELLKHREVGRGRLVRAQHPTAQLYEIVNLFGLHSELAPFSRCLRCNGLLEAVDKQSVLERLEPLTKKYYSIFKRCESCARIYWKGSHHEKMTALLRPLMPEADI